LLLDFEEHYDQTEDNLIPEKISNGHSGEQDLVSELQAEVFTFNFFSNNAFQF